jgi:hypothetical protein
MICEHCLNDKLPMYGRLCVKCAAIIGELEHIEPRVSQSCQVIAVLTPLQGKLPVTDDLEIEVGNLLSYRRHERNLRSELTMLKDSFKVLSEPAQADRKTEIE